MMGLSPRGRGNHRRGHRRNAYLRSIPAWAGKPMTDLKTGHVYKVYPRVGGETIGSTSLAWPCTGLSPRGRGNR